jgi:hypothetical protein
MRPEAIRDEKPENVERLEAVRIFSTLIRMTYGLNYLDRNRFARQRGISFAKSGR